MSDQTRQDVYEEISVYLDYQRVPWQDDGITLYDGQGSLSRASR